MIKSIFVAASGSDSDTPVFETAFAAAQPLAAHLHFVHLQPRLGEAALNTPHADFAMGPAVGSTFDHLKTDIARRSSAAKQHVHEFCERHGIGIGGEPQASDKVSASLEEITGDALECLTFAARHRDLVVLGRMNGPNGLPNDLVDMLVLRTGRPILVAPAGGRDTITGTVLVCWNETAEAARAIAAAMPLLAKAEHVILVAVDEDDSSAADALKAGLAATAQQLGWHGIAAEAQFVPAAGRSAADVLSSLARARNADLVVMGGYGHGRFHELVFGGCTRHFLRDPAVAVFLLH